MIRLIQDVGLTLLALLRLIRDFFVRWFLPMHMDEEDPVSEDVWAEEKKPAPAALPPATELEGPSEPPIAESESPEPDAETSPAPETRPAPVIAPPVGAEERVSRDMPQWTRAEPWADIEKETEETEPAEDQPAPESPSVEDSNPSPTPPPTDPAPSPVNPFAPDPPEAKP